MTTRLFLAIVVTVVSLHFASCSAEIRGHLSNVTSLRPTFNRTGLVRSKRATSAQFDFVHHDYDQLTDFLKMVSQKYPQITRLYSIGQSVQGRKLWVMEISDKPGVHEVGEPEIKYIGNIHGNEVVGREILILLIQLLTESYGHDKALTELVDNTRMHIMPSMNPDGREVAREGDCHTVLGRKNAHGVDMNRGFPDEFQTQSKSDGSERQPEIYAAMKWFREFPFVLSANLHGGGLVVNYPFDFSKNGNNDQEPNRSPDEAIFQQLSMAFSKNNPVMYRYGQDCNGVCKDSQLEPENSHFSKGITNGAQWYSFSGGMQDYNYLYTNCFEVTIELGCYKFPYAKDLQKFWQQNQKSLIAYIEQVHKGVKGVVKDSNGKPLGNVVVSVQSIDHDVTTHSSGDYWRLLTPGKYQLAFKKTGYEPLTRQVTVGTGKATVLDVILTKSPPGQKVVNYAASRLPKLEKRQRGLNALFNLFKIKK